MPSTSVNGHQQRQQTTRFCHPTATPTNWQPAQQHQQQQQQQQQPLAPNTPRPDQLLQQKPQFQQGTSPIWIRDPHPAVDPAGHPDQMPIDGSTPNTPPVAEGSGGLALSVEKSRVAEIALVWIAVSLVNLWAAFPVEWLFFLYYTATVLFRSYSVGLAVFGLLFSVLVIADLLVYYSLPFRVTAVASTALVNSFLVCGAYDMNYLRVSDRHSVWFLVSGMMAVRLTIWSMSTAAAAFNTATPLRIADGIMSSHPQPQNSEATAFGRFIWNQIYPPQEPPHLVSAVAAHCTGFGLCYFTWRLGYLLYSNLDRLVAALGLLPPEQPSLSVLYLGESVFEIHWRALNRFTGERNSDVHPGPVDPEFSDVRAFAVEVNGILIGEVGGHERTVLVTGLSPDTRYRIRVKHTDTVAPRPCSDLDLWIKHR
ncbi:hypothetical protein HK405_006279 [Cladochytrium tenue]|nr:hypothetical protein HK405_006279 [Cladochytrium tenue]